MKSCGREYSLGLILLLEVSLGWFHLAARKALSEFYSSFTLNLSVLHDIAHLLALAVAASATRHFVSRIVPCALFLLLVINVARFVDRLLVTGRGLVTLRAI